MATKQKRRTAWPQWLQKLGQNLTSLRDKGKLTNEQIAGDLEVSRWTVSRWMSGRYAPTVEHLYDLATLFKVEVRQIVPPLRS